MADDTTTSVKIVADASGVAPGVDVAKTDLGELAPMIQAMTAQFAELSASIKASMVQGAAATAEMATEMAKLEEETERESISLKEIALGAHEAVEGFASMRASLSEIAEVWIAAFAVEQIADWAKEFAEASEKIEHLAQTFGMTTAQVQQLNGIAISTGISIEAITKGMQVLDKNAIAASGSNSAVANALKAVGISANDGMTQMQRLEAVADKFKNMDDGPKKVALAMELMGRSGAALIPILNLGSDGLAELAAKAKEYDVANTEVSDSAQEKGAALAESINEAKLAWQGITTVLGDAFAPVLKYITDGLDSLVKTMIDSYNEGGTVAVVFGTIAAVVEVVGGVINALAGIFVALWDAVVTVVSDIVHAVTDAFGAKIPESSKETRVALNLILDAIVLLKDGWIAIIQTLEAGMVELVDVVKAAAHVIYDAFSLNWSGVKADWDKGLNDLSADTTKWAANIKATAADVSKTVAAAMLGQGPTTGGGVKTGEGGAGGDFNPTLGATPKEKKPKDDLVQKLDEELTAKKLAWSMEQDAQDSAQQYSLASEAQFWADALQQANLSAKDRAEIETKYLAAHSQLVKEDIQKVIDSYKAQLDAHKSNAAASLQIATEEAAFIKQKYGDQSTQYAAAMDQIAKITKQVAEQRIQIETEAAKQIEALTNLDLTAQENAAKFRVSMGAETQQRLLAQEREFENQKYALQAQALQRAKAIIDPSMDPVKYQQMANQIETLARAHQTKLTQIDQQATLQRTAIERTAENQTASLWGTNIAKMLTLQQGFAATVRSLYSGMVDVISGALGKVIENWLAQQLSAMLFKKAIQTTDGVATVTSNAAIAASAAFASTAAIPIVGPELAPAAAAAALGATMAFAPMASASGGFDIPSGVNPLTQLHQEEMVLPSSLANPLRSLIRSGAANNNAPAAANQTGGGDSYHIHAVDAASFKKLLMDHASAVGAAIRKHVRQGGNTKPI